MKTGSDRCITDDQNSYVEAPAEVGFHTAGSQLQQLRAPTWACDLGIILASLLGIYDYILLLQQKGRH